MTPAQSLRMYNAHAEIAAVYLETGEIDSAKIHTMISEWWKKNPTDKPKAIVHDTNASPFVGCNDCNRIMPEARFHERKLHSEDCPLFVPVLVKE